jgi:hypothetical protein
MTLQPGQGGALWLPDPAGRFDQRYWDGHAWTTAVMIGGQVQSDADPLPEGEPGAAVASPLPPPPVASGPAHVPAARPGDRYTSLRPDEAQRRLGQMLQMQGWSIAVPASDRFEVSVSTPGKPNVIVGLLLFLWLIVPGIIYFAIKSRPTVSRASMTFIPEGDGTRIALQGTPEALQQLGAVMVMLPW